MPRTKFTSYMTKIAKVIDGTYDDLEIQKKELKRENRKKVKIKKEGK